MKIIVFILCVLYLSSCKTTKDCSGFKTGTFQYVDSNLKHITIQRNDTIQVENNIKDEIKITTSVKWLSNCNYVLTYKDVTGYEYKEDIIGKEIFVNVLSVEGNIYTSRVKSSTTNTIVKMIKLKY